MRARNGNIAFQGTQTTDNLDFSFLDNLGFGIDYTNLGGSDRILGTNFDDTFTLSSGAEVINGRGGSDRVIYRNSTAAVNVNLNQTLQSGGFAAGDQLTSIENVTGSQNYGDTLTGNNAANILEGLGGNDIISGGGGDDRLLGGDGHDVLAGGSGDNIINGGSGTDTVDYSNSTFAVGVGLETGQGAELQNFDGDLYAPDIAIVEHDTLSGIENVIGSAFGDMLAGDAGANVIEGKAGDDFIYGKAGNDTEYGGAGNDHLGTFVINLGALGVGIVDDEGDDKLYGEAGDDVLIGGSGADLMDGGEGFDTADYSLSPEAVFVDLSTGHGSRYGSWANNDTLVSIEKVIGSQFDDFFNGSAGNDQFFGNGGDDDMVGGAGADVLNGGGGIDMISYLSSAAGVRVNLQTGSGVGGDAQGDTFSGIENVLGSFVNDRLTGSDADNLLVSVAGDDTIVGNGGDDMIEGGDGNDKMAGGADADTFAFRTNADPFALSPAAADGHDVITDFEVGIDHLAFAGTALTELSIQQDGSDTVIKYADGQGSVTLYGVDAIELLQHAQTDMLFY